MKADMEKVRMRRRAITALAALSLATVVALLAGCFESHVQETVTVAPRSAATPALATTDAANSISSAAAVDAETEAAGDALAHAAVALRTRRRDEALYYMNVARARLTHRINRTATDANANSNPTRERLMNDLRELDSAERSARHNDFQESRAQLSSISDELDHLNSSLVRRLN
jgi:hypothetical protein